MHHRHPYQVITMTNQLHLSAQLATLGSVDPQAAQSLWAIVLQSTPPDDLRRLMAALPPTGAVAEACRSGLLSLALERHTTPLTLGPK
jgi:hypothetical protein